MATQNLSNLKGNLTDYVNSITRRSKGGLYVCPLCKSGTHEHKDGAFSIYSNGERCKCFSCGFGDGKGNGADIFDLCAEYEGLTIADATKRIIERYGTADGRGAARVSDEPLTITPTKQPTASGDEMTKPQEDNNFTDDIERFAAALPGSPAESYLRGRGLTLETMRRFRLGFNSEANTVTIPYNPQGSYYGQRSVNPNATRKHNNLKGVTMPLFNAAALNTAPVVFVVESPLCAISIAQEGGAAVALAGTGGKGRLIEQLKNKPTTAALVLCLDNDKAGRDATADLDAALDEIGVFHVDGTAAIMGECTEPGAADYRKDPNEVLQRSGADELKAAVEEVAEATREAQQAVKRDAEQERRQRTGAGIVDSFLQAIQTRKYEPMPTGITDIDKAIGGGFTRQQVVMLGAAPGVGKTALAQWIFEGMAQRGGNTCLYINLEMSREQILARSIARIAARKGKKINTLQIMQGYKWTDEQRAIITDAAQEYCNNIAPYMIYNPDGLTANLDNILSYCEQEAKHAEAAYLPAPVVVVDYLQLIVGDAREDASTVIKRAVAGFKAYAIKHNTIVFVIIAHNRNSNQTGAVSMESARDTSAIEYSADLQLALTFTACLKRDGQTAKNPDELTPDEMKRVTLKIVKGRFGGRGTDVDLHFDGATMTYTQSAAGLVESREATPFDNNGGMGTKKGRF